MSYLDINKYNEPNYVTVQNVQICQPAYVYMVLAIIVLCVSVFLQLFMSGTVGSFTEILSQFFAILFCTLLLMVICSFAPALSWIFTIIYILCLISGIFGMAFSSTTRV